MVIAKYVPNQKSAEKRPPNKNPFRNDDFCMGRKSLISKNYSLTILLFYLATNLPSCRKTIGKASKIGF